MIDGRRREYDGHLGIQSASRCSYEPARSGLPPAALVLDLPFRPVGTHLDLHPPVLGLARGKFQDLHAVAKTRTVGALARHERRPV